jgi:hypothetical protein
MGLQLPYLPTTSAVAQDIHVQQISSLVHPLTWNLQTNQNPRFNCRYLTTPGKLSSYVKSVTIL